MRTLVAQAFENFLLREISVRKADQFIRRLASAKSYNTADQARTVVSLVFGLHRRARPVRMPCRHGDRESRMSPCNTGDRLQARAATTPAPTRGPVDCAG
jgi:hypothetical protein